MLITERPGAHSVGQIDGNSFEWHFSSMILAYPSCGCRERCPLGPSALDTTRNVTVLFDVRARHPSPASAARRLLSLLRILVSGALKVCPGILLRLLRIWACRALLLSLGSPQWHRQRAPGSRGGRRVCSVGVCVDQKSVEFENRDLSLCKNDERNIYGYTSL